MAAVTAIALRQRAREAMLAAGGRGFMRFCDAGDALLVCDAPRRCADDAARQRLADALADAGFAGRLEDGLLLLTPEDGVLRACGRDAPPCAVTDWDGPLAPAQALAARFLREEARPLTADGRRIVLATLRLLWQDAAHVSAGLIGLRAQAAALLRAGDRSGLYEAGALLARWCGEQEEGG